MTWRAPVLLALFPNSIGIGYVCLQVPDRLFDYGVATTKPVLNGKLLKRVERFMDYYRPKVILLKEVTEQGNGKRTDKLIEAITTLAGEKDIAVFRYTRQQVNDVFEVFHATTKHEKVQKIAQMLPELAHRAPRDRKWYEKEDYNMALFNAVALAVTHTHLTE